MGEALCPAIESLKSRSVKIVVIICGTARTHLDIAHWAAYLEACSHSTGKIYFQDQRLRIVSFSKNHHQSKILCINVSFNSFATCLNLITLIERI